MERPAVGTHAKVHSATKQILGGVVTEHSESDPTIFWLQTLTVNGEAKEAGLYPAPFPYHVSELVEQ